MGRAILPTTLVCISCIRRLQNSVQAVEVREAADEHTAQASAAGQRATAAEQEAQHLEAQGKFADAAAAALQADRYAVLPLRPLMPSVIRYFFNCFPICRRSVLTEPHVNRNLSSSCQLVFNKAIQNENAADLTE